MANTDTPMGFKPVRYLNGSAYDGKARVCYVPATDSTAIGLYDLVTPAGESSSDGKYLIVARSAATETDILGSVIGFGTTPHMAFDPDTLSRSYRPASTAMYVWVADDPDLLFVAQDDGDTTTLATTDVGRNLDIVVANCSTTTGLSAMELDASDIKDATAQIRIEGVYDEPGNTAGANCKWLCRINEHAYRNTTGT